MHEWNDFFVATAGASAGLTGLIFVGISISLTKILSFSTLPARALVSLVLLVTVMVASLFVLIPSQAVNSVGIETGLTGLFSWAAVTYTDIIAIRNKPTQYKRQQTLIAFIDQLALLPYIIAGIRILTIGEAGMYLLVPGIILCFLKAVTDAWVLLVEVNR